jgi:hypothetical protein
MPGMFLLLVDIPMPFFNDDTFPFFRNVSFSIYIPHFLCKNLRNPDSYHIVSISNMIKLWAPFCSTPKLQSSSLYTASILNIQHSLPRNMGGIALVLQHFNWVVLLIYFPNTHCISLDISSVLFVRLLLNFNPNNYNLTLILV